MLKYIRSIRGPRKFEELRCKLDQTIYLDVIIVVESWLKDGEQDFFQLKNYDLRTSNRLGKIGGGLIIYVRREWEVEQIKSLNKFDVNHQILSVKISKSPPFRSYPLTVVYV